MLKVLLARALPGWQGAKTAGTVIALPDSSIAVATGRGALILEKVQLAGKRAMAPETFCLGCRDFVGSTLE